MPASRVPEQQAIATERTRLAPSPTGALHLGNARTFLIGWALARQRGWRVLMRIEDLDTPRVKAGAEEALLDTLAWLGIDWDEGPLRQSDDLEPYREAMRRLAEARSVYPLDLTRAEIEASSSAPQQGAQELRCPPGLRPRTMPEHFDEPARSWRFATASGVITAHDLFMGELAHDPSVEVGDFVVWTKREQPSYQLAVVVDDQRQGVTQVVRGDDLASSTARQLMLARAMGLTWSPAFTHVPLVLGADGKRLAKRHGDTRLTVYREAGVPPERVIGLLAWWCAVIDRREPMSVEAFVERFDLDTVPRQPVSFGEEDDAWLRSHDAGSSHSAPWSSR